LNKTPGFDNVSTEHALGVWRFSSVQFAKINVVLSAKALQDQGGDLYVHLCLLFNTMVQHCYVPEKFGHGLIVPLLKDKQGNQSRSDM